MRIPKQDPDPWGKMNVDPQHEPPLSRNIAHSLGMGGGVVKIRYSRLRRGLHHWLVQVCTKVVRIRITSEIRHWSKIISRFHAHESTTNTDPGTLNQKWGPSPPPPKCRSFNRSILANFSFNGDNFLKSRFRGISRLFLFAHNQRGDPGNVWKNNRNYKKIF
jgi:hypothetical protein